MSKTYVGVSKNKLITFTTFAVFLTFIAFVSSVMQPISYLRITSKFGISPFPSIWAVEQSISKLQIDAEYFCERANILSYYGSFGEVVPMNSDDPLKWQGSPENVVLFSSDYMTESRKSLISKMANFNDLYLENCLVY